MKRRTFVLALGGAGLACSQAVAAELRTIVMVRHGEKPPQGLGQLSCRGLNRSLRLPAVIAAKFGRPDAVFAPDPSKRKKDEGVRYDYVRPLATIEPTAVFFGLPVNASYGYQDLAGLQRALEADRYRAATLLVGWEHKEIEKLARRLLAAHGGDPAQVPDWHGDDFDSIFVLRLAQDGAARTATFAHLRQGLDGLPETCPGG